MTADSRSLDARTSDAVRRLLDLEDDAPDVVRETLPGASVPFWAQVRMRVAWALSAQQTGSVDVTPGTWNRWKQARRIARAQLPDRWDAPRRARRHDVCFYVGGGTLAASDGTALNWLVDDFAGAAGDAVVVQQQPLPSPLGRPSFRPTLTMDAANARVTMRVRGAHPSDAVGRSIESLLADFARRLGQEPGAFAKIAQRAVRDENYRRPQLDELRRLIDRVRPRVVLFDNGSYTYHGESVGLFKDAGAYVAEPQHGWIGPSHAAYNYGRLFREPALRRALPDEVLTFGDFWSDSIRHPGRVTAIGKPHLERQAASAPASRRPQVLVVSSRTDPERTDALVIELRGLLDDSWSVVFRPHPGERYETGGRYPRLSAHPGVTVDEQPDVYESLKQTTVVVGEASTVLFEARAFGCEVIPRDSAFAAAVIGDAFGDRVQDARQIADRIRSSAGHRTAARVDDSIWATHAVQNFRDWLAASLDSEDSPRAGSSEPA
ncbi:conserved protein of unknown function [Microbacterium sp. Nx66]|uniref:hypothetical protein n=1 Tax=Microbacterium sp. Nx66 TaxID=2766784 RepID=UPI001656A043|nr:hypothetical protein [Microbacterium sp. Nx66]CAD5138677.1 conserved protein of unknown function [Microbacterium sp. Nx66]